MTLHKTNVSNDRHHQLVRGRPEEVPSLHPTLVCQRGTFACRGGVDAGPCTRLAETDIPWCSATTTAPCDMKSIINSSPGIPRKSPLYNSPSCPSVGHLRTEAGWTPNSSVPRRCRSIVRSQSRERAAPSHNGELCTDDGAPFASSQICLMCAS